MQPNTRVGLGNLLSVRNGAAALEAEERRYLLLVCKWNWYPPYFPTRQTSYESLLTYWDFLALRRLLRYTRLKLIWRTLHTKPRLNKATLLWVLSFQETCFRTDWDRILDDDLALLSLSCGVARSRAEWLRSRKSRPTRSGRGRRPVCSPLHELYHVIR